MDLKAYAEIIVLASTHVVRKVAFKVYATALACSKTIDSTSIGSF